MKLKTKMGFIGLGIIVLLGVIGGIYGLMSKKNTTTSNQTTLPKENLTKKLEPRLIWEKEFDGNIIDLIVPKLPTIRKKGEFPIVAMQVEKKTGEVNVWGGPEDVTETKIIFFDKKGKERVWKRTLTYIPWKKGEGAVISNDGKYVLISKGIEEFVCDFVYTTQKGDILWEKKKVEGGEPEVSPFGNVITLIGSEDGGEERLCFYNKKGENMKEYPEFHITACNRKFSEDEKFCYYILYTLKEGDSEESLVLFDKRGELLWRYDFGDNRETRNLSISFHGEIIALVRSSYKEEDIYIYLFNNQGKLLMKRGWEKIFTPDRTKVIFTIEDIVLSPSGRYLLIRFTDSFTLFETLTGKELFSIRLADIKNYFISPDGNFTFVVCNDSSQGEKLIVINKKGEIIFEQGYSRECLSDVKFMDNGAYLIYHKSGEWVSKLKIMEVIW